MANHLRKLGVFVWSGFFLLAVVAASIFGGESAAPAFNPIPLFGLEESEREDGGYFILIDEQGSELIETALKVRKGDEFINQDNRRYLVSQVEGNLARCRFVGVEELMEQEIPENGMAAAAAFGQPSSPGAVVGVYHTHGGECYLPSEGKRSVNGRGGVAEVTSALAAKLNSLGVNTVYHDAPHSPINRSSYRRSRGTAVDLINRGANVLIDVHRNAAPVNKYLARMDNQTVAGILITIGRQNPHYTANLGFAKYLKAKIDGMYPDLVKGIYLGRGVYNQDLLPTSILIEAGTYQMTVEQAKMGVSRFAEAIPGVLETYPAFGPTRIKPEADQGGSWKALGLTVMALLLGGAGYLYLRTGSWEGMMARLQQFRTQEWEDLRRGVSQESIKNWLQPYVDRVRAVWRRLPVQPHPYWRKRLSGEREAKPGSRLSPRPLSGRRRRPD